MKLRRSTPMMALVTCLVATACGPPPPPQAVFTPDNGTPAGTLAPTASAVPGASGPVAVITTNANRQGSTYDIALVDSAGVVKRRITAKLPLIKPNQTQDYPLVSASDNLVYYLDGDTEVHSMGFSGGSTPVVKTIADGATKEIAFAVSPDNATIAVSVMAQAANVDNSTGHGYVENLADSGNHIDLFSNTGTDSFRWPVGWQSKNVVDAVGHGMCDLGAPYALATGCVASYHVIDSGNGHRVATVCESAQSTTNDNVDSLSPMGLPTVAGTACSVTKVTQTPGNTTVTTALTTIDWVGQSRTVIAATTNPATAECFLSSTGDQLACANSQNGALTIVRRDGTSRDVGRRYNILGWIDGNHLAVGIDSTTLGILTADTGAVVNVKFPGADQAQLATTLPGGF